jgi:hypothetical protein
MTDFCRNTEVNLRGTPRFPSNWEVSDKCRVIRQTANSDPTALIGNKTVRYSGRLTNTFLIIKIQQFGFKESLDLKKMTQYSVKLSMTHRLSLTSGWLRD